MVAPVLLAGCHEDLTSANGGSLRVVAGNNQLGVIGTALPREVRIRAADKDGMGLAGQRVSFTIESGGGSVTPVEAVTNFSGEATATWTLGPVAGTNQLRASSSAFPSVGLAATAEMTLFDIDVRFLSPVSDGQRAAFHAATTHWRRTIIGELSSVPLTTQAGQCGPQSPALSETVDDLIIFVVIEPIDGVRGALATAGPCFVRTSNTLPLVGAMRLDAADLASLEQSGDLEGVILHEMGHVLGVGTLWESVGLLADPAETGGTDPHFTGTAAIGAFDSGGGSAYDGGKVPVEDTGGSGTRDGHWRESILDTELMTGFLDAQQLNPLSRITIASLEDIGYTVNADAADPFTVVIPAAAVARRKTTIPFGADLYTGPIYRVGSDGSLRLVR